MGSIVHRIRRAIKKKGTERPMVQALSSPSDTFVFNTKSLMGYDLELILRAFIFNKDILWNSDLELRLRAFLFNIETLAGSDIEFTLRAFNRWPH